MTRTLRKSICHLAILLVFIINNVAWADQRDFFLDKDHDYYYDASNGLVWMRLNGNKYSYPEAKEYCEVGMNKAMGSNWRLPNVTEASTLWNRTANSGNKEKMDALNELIARGQTFASGYLLFPLALTKADGPFSGYYASAGKPSRIQLFSSLNIFTVSYDSVTAQTVPTDRIGEDHKKVFADKRLNALCVREIWACPNPKDLRADFSGNLHSGSDKFIPMKAAGVFHITNQNANLDKAVLKGIELEKNYVECRYDFYNANDSWIASLTLQTAKYDVPKDWHLLPDMGQSNAGGRYCHGSRCLIEIRK